MTIRMLTIRSQGKSTTLNYSQPETDPSNCTRIVHSFERGGILGKTKNKRLHLLLFDDIRKFSGYVKRKKVTY